MIFNKDKKRLKTGNTTQNMKKLIGNNMNFAASEAYKTLRTNIAYLFPDESGCKIIGVTSSNQSEGKSLTAINLAYFISKSNKNILLIEGDMRLPSIGKKLRVRQGAGLSNLLIDPGLDRNETMIDYGRLHVLFAGDIPPNPSELLESRAMKELMAYYSQLFDYIILDLPPVNICADALIASHLVHGMLLVVRHNTTERNQLSEAVKSLDMIGAKIIGFVYNGMNEKTDSNYSNNYYRNYYKAAESAKQKKAAETKPENERTS